jgi:topoisomerase IA-like protein
VKYGFYIKYGDMTFSVEENIIIDEIIEDKKEKVFTINKKTINLKDKKFSPYLQIGKKYSCVR